MNTKGLTGSAVSSESEIPIDQLLTEAVRAVFASVHSLDADALAGITVPASDSDRFGDYQCNAAMGLAKALRKAPREIAQAVADCPDWPGCVRRVEVAGPGFINIHLDDAWLARRVEALMADDRLGVPVLGAGRTVVIDYSSPNVAKPMHIGHMRSINIGNALDRLYRFAGFEVVSDNHLGDWGTQFGLLIKGYRAFVDKQAFENDPVAELERVYVKSYEEGKADDGWRAACREELVKLQAGDSGNQELWRTFVDLSLADFNRMYERVNVRFDLVRGESHYNDRLPGVVDLLEQKGIAEQSEGATVVFLEEEGLPVCIVRKSDGGFNYATTDLATVMSRVEEFAPETIIYVTDERQQNHFRQFFAICRRLGIEVDLQHVWFGLMRLPDRTFSTREGNVIRLDRLLDEAEERALKVVQENSPEMDPAAQREVARKVGIGAVKYADLSQNPQTLVTFEWEKALALEGNSGPYLQYAHARIRSVRDKYQERFPDGDPDTQPVMLSETVERTLALKVARFPEAVLLAVRTYKPSVIADYLYELAQAYSSYYQNVPFLKADKGIRESRVRLCGAVAAVLRTGLELLGIEAPERI